MVNRPQHKLTIEVLQDAAVAVLDIVTKWFSKS